MEWSTLALVGVLLGFGLYLSHLKGKSVQLDQAREELGLQKARADRWKEVDEVSKQVDNAVDWVHNNRAEFRRLLLDAVKKRDAARATSN